MPIGFRGQIYSKTDTATSDAVRRFETSSNYKLSRCIIQVTGNTQYFGSATVYPVYVEPGKFELVNVDLSTLYFANYAAGQNGTVSIIGVYAD